MLMLPQDPGQAGSHAQSPCNPSSPMSSVIPPWLTTPLFQIPWHALMTDSVPHPQPWAFSPFSLACRAEHCPSLSWQPSPVTHPGTEHLLLHGGIDLAPSSTQLEHFHLPVTGMPLVPFLCTRNHSDPVIQLLCKRSLGLQILATHNPATV